MKSVIEDIYYGKWSVENFKPSEEYGKISDECDKLYKEIEKHLNKEQRKNLFDLVVKDGGLEAETACTHFKEGFKLGFLIAVEVFT